MGLVKRDYVDQVTVITAQNLNDIQDAIIANENNKANLTVIAGVEAISTASKAYSVGEYLVLNGILYKVTAAIEEEDTITDTGAGANVTSKTVGEELTDISDITGDGTLSDFTATDLTGAANELKTSLNNLDSDDIANASTNVSGATVSAALDALGSIIKSKKFTSTASTTFAVPNNSYHLLVIGSTNANAYGIFIVKCFSNSATIVDVIIGNNISHTTSGANVTFSFVDGTARNFGIIEFCVYGSAIF